MVMSKNSVEVISNDDLPKMEVSLPETNDLIEDKKLLGVYDEIIDNLRDDREEISDLIGKFANMVLNDCDPSSASKEALVNLIKAKSDTADKMAKVAELMTRVKLKDNAMPRFLAAQQNNKFFNVKGDMGKNLKKQLIKELNKVKKVGDDVE